MKGMKWWKAGGVGVLVAAAVPVAAAMAAGNSDVAGLVETAPSGPYVASTLVVVLVALLLAAGFLKRSNR